MSGNREGRSAGLNDENFAIPRFFLAVLAGLNIAVALGVGSIAFLANGFLSAIDLGVVSLILFGGGAPSDDQSEARGRKMSVRWIFAAFGAGSFCLIAGAISLAGNLPVNPGWVSLIFIPPLILGIRMVYRAVSDRQTKCERLKQGLLLRYCRFTIYRLLFMSVILLISKVWNPVVDLLAGQALGIAIMQLGIEINWGRLENPFHVSRGSRVRAVIEEYARRAAGGRATISRVVMQGTLADLSVSIFWADILPLREKGLLEINIRDQLILSFPEIRRLRVAMVPGQDMV